MMIIAQRINAGRFLIPISKFNNRIFFRPAHLLLGPLPKTELSRIAYKVNFYMSNIILLTQYFWDDMKEYIQHKKFIEVWRSSHSITEKIIFVTSGSKPVIRRGIAWNVPPIVSIRLETKGGFFVCYQIAFQL
ncbi:MAG: hypothetical protein AABY87_02480 [bacterium]